MTWRIKPDAAGALYSFRGGKGEVGIATYLPREKQDELFSITASEDGKAVKLVFRGPSRERQSVGYAYSVTAWYVDPETKQPKACPLHDPIVVNHD